jgi:hypothetical protein
MSAASDPKKNPLDDSRIRDLERQLTDESSKTCSHADRAIEEGKKICESSKTARDSKKFKIPSSKIRRTA